MKRTFALFDGTETKVIVEAEQVGHEWRALCPKHDDHSPSLQINAEKGVYHCMGCDFKGHLWKEDVCYSYEDETGQLLFQVVRTPSKQFKCRRPNGQGWEWNLEGVKRVLYHLPEIIQSSGQIIIVEGEKDVDRLRGLGLVVTTNQGGAGKWKPEYNVCLKGRDVVILPDNDGPGLDHASKVAESLQGVARSVKLVRLPGLAEKEDVSDWLDRSGTCEKLQELIKEAPEYEEPKSFLEAGAISFGSFTSMDIRTEWVIKGLIPKNALTVLYGDSDIGKSHLLALMGYSASTGKSFLGLDTIPLSVRYVDYENPLSTWPHFEKLFGASPMKIIHSAKVILPPIDGNNWKEFLKLPRGLILFDGLRAACSRGTNNDDEHMQLVMSRFMEMRNKGFTVVVLHHTPKYDNKVLKGSTVIYNMADLALAMFRVKRIGEEKALWEEDYASKEPKLLYLGKGVKSRFEPFKIYILFEGLEGLR